MSKAFNINEDAKRYDGLTVSRDAGLRSEQSIIHFLLGSKTSISQEAYDTAAIYLGSGGTAKFLVGAEAIHLSEGDLLIVPGKTLCGVVADEAVTYTEIITKEEIKMNPKIKAGESVKLKDLIQYETGSIVNMDAAHNEKMKFVLMAFDEGTGLQPHRAPGDALVTALEGQASIGYEGVEHILNEGESFRFEKDGLHSVTAKGKFKMSLLLVLE